MRSNIELLLMMAQSAQAEGDEIVNENNKTYAAHARRLEELSQMIDHARALVDAEKVRFQRWLPQEGQHAAQIGVVQGDNQREYPRTLAPRQSATVTPPDRGDSARERPTHPPLGTQAGTQAPRAVRAPS